MHDQKAAGQMPSETPKANMVPENVLRRCAAVAANTIKVRGISRFQGQKMSGLGRAAESCRPEMLPLQLRKNY